MRYWEAWADGDDGFVVHHGIVGETGRTERITDGLFRMANNRLHRRTRKQRAAGFLELRESDHFVLSIEFAVEPGQRNIVTRQRALEDRMNKTLGRTGLGSVDGGSVSKDTMEVTVRAGRVICIEGSIPTNSDRSATALVEAMVKERASESAGQRLAVFLQAAEFPWKWPPINPVYREPS